MEVLYSASGHSKDQSIPGCGVVSEETAAPIDRIYRYSVTRSPGLQSERRES